MNALRTLIREIHRRSLWQVLGIYLVASWGVLEAVGGIAESAGLPDWLPSFALILLLLGLPVVLATAFVQEGLGGPSSADSGRPGSDEDSGSGRPQETSAPPTEPTELATTPGAAASIFTWRNALAAGVAAFALWGVAATVILMRGLADPPTAPETATPSIAVIPFENMAGEDNRYFTDGIHEDVITALTKVGGLKVISRTSVLEFSDPQTRPPIQEIARMLGVGAVLEGSVRRQGSRVRVTAQLIDGQNEGHLWAEQFDRSVTDVFALQADLAREIAGQLGARLAPGAAAQLDRVPTENAEAYDLYLRARTAGGWRAAAEVLERAVALDPGFAEAWAALSSNRSQAYQWSEDRSPDNLARSLEAAERALELDPDLPEGHYALGVYHYRCCRENERALVALSRASALRPGWSTVIQAEGSIARRAGHFDLALEKYRQAAELDPRGSVGSSDLAITLAITRRYDEAEAMLRRLGDWRPRSASVWRYLAATRLYGGGDVAEVLRADSVNGPAWKAWMRLQMGDVEGASLDLAAVDGPWALQGVNELIPASLLRADRLHRLGRAEEAAREARAAVQLLSANEAYDRSDHRVYLHRAHARALAADTSGARSDLATLGELAQRDAIWRVFHQGARLEVEVLLGDVDAALDALEWLVTAEGGAWSVEGLDRSSRVDPIRDDPRYRALVDRLRAEGH